MLPAASSNGVVPVAGASSGIGEELAREFAGRGRHVVLVARRAEKLQALAGSLGSAADVLAADLSKPDERAALPDRVAALGLVVDVLVNNAGLSTVGRSAESDPVAELNLVEVDVAAVVDLCSRFVPGMVSRGRGALSYNQALGEELRGTGVAVATLCPGPVKTGFGETAGIADEDAEAARPKAMWIDADGVARAAIDGLEAGRTVIVPGTFNRVGADAYQLLPRKLLLPILARSHPALKKR